jgi:FtsP/CotA-like multicopper oxidase with cupredoxin domain
MRINAAMNKYFALAGLAVVLTGCSDNITPAQIPAQVASAAAPAPAADESALTEQAKAAAQALGVTLKAELEAAMQTGGPVAAMSVCQIKAPELAAAISLAKGMTVKRVSLKNRNPVTGIANEWQTQVLQDFETRKAAGEDPATLIYTAVIDDEYRFMQAIPTATVCLVCHGNDLSPAVIAKLAELYPQDKATGYKEGDLRGAFVVVKNLPRY